MVSLDPKVFLTSHVPTCLRHHLGCETSLPRPWVRVAIQLNKVGPGADSL